MMQRVIRRAKPISPGFNHNTPTAASSLHRRYASQQQNTEKREPPNPWTIPEGFQFRRAAFPAIAIDPMNPNANVDLSDTVMLFARKYQIASWFDLKPIPRDPRWKELMTLHLSSRHAFSVNHAPFFSYFEQPLTHKYLARYVPMKSIPLWIWVHVFAMADGCPAIVRSGCTRKITAAVRSALRKNGYDRHGWASDGSGKVLQGTLKVNAYKTKDIMKLPFPELVGFFSRTVQKTLIPRLSKPVFYKVK